MLDGAPVTAVDLVLRPNAREARRTVDLLEIWGGELVFEDLPVMNAEKIRPRPKTGEGGK